MTEKLKEIIKNESVKLPKESQEVINTFGWAAISEEIGKKYLLRESEINDLQVEIALVLLGINEEDLLSLNIEDNVGTSTSDADKMTEEINKQILTPMFEKKESLMKNKPKTISPNWKQNVNFVISGGDYSVFEEESGNIQKPKVEYREVI